MDASTNKLLMVFGSVIAICAIIIAAGSVVSMTHASSSEKDNSAEWSEIASCLDKNGGTIYCIADSGASVTNSVYVNASYTVTAENGFLKVINGNSVTAVPFNNITHVNYSQA